MPPFQTSLTTCGAMRPTKPMGPASAVVAPHMSTAAAEATRRTRLGLAPSPTAASSPRARTSSADEQARDSSMPTTHTGQRIASDSQLAPETLPICQNRNVSITLERGITMMLTSELSATETAVPARASLSGVVPPTEPIPNTRKVVTAAPSVARTRYCSAVVMPRNAMPHTTASDAPEFTPRIEGSAMGLRVTICMSRPLTPNAAPASRQNMRRGTRSSTTAMEKSSATGTPRKMSTTSPTGTIRAPWDRDTAPTNIRRTTRMTAPPRGCLHGCIGYALSSALDNTSRYWSIVAGMESGPGVQDAASGSSPLSRATAPCWIQGSLPRSGSA